jgi:type I restriction enzyme, S subunit
VSDALPQGWAEAQLGGVVYYQEGPGLRKWQFGDSGIPFLNIRTFENGRINRSRCQFVKISEFGGKYEHFLLEAGDIVVSSSGTLGKIAVVTESDLPLMLNTSTIRFRSLSEDVLVQEFLRYFLLSSRFTEQIEASKTGSAIFNYGPSHLRGMSITLPPAPEQRRIVAKLEALLSKVDSCRKRLDRIPALLKRFRQALLAAACSGRLTADWRDSATGAGVLPSDWQCVEFGAVIRHGPHNGLYKPQTSYGTGTPIVRIDAFYDGSITNWADLKRVRLEKLEIEQFALKDADILINRVNSPKFLGKSALVCRMPEPSVYESNMMRLRLDTSRTLPDYAILYLQSAQGLVELRKNAKHAVNQSSINQTDVRSALFALPPLPEQHEIVRRVDALFTLSDQIEARHARAKVHVDKLTQSILAKAFRGELVAQDPRDEPANVMLERIRPGQRQQR